MVRTEKLPSCRNNPNVKMRALRAEVGHPHAEVVLLKHTDPE